MAGREKPDWLDEVNDRRLHMKNCFKCMLGQLFKSYWNIVRLHDNDYTKLPEQWAVDHGFVSLEAIQDLDASECLLYYGDLEVAWIERIITRRKEHAGQASHNSL